MPQVCPWSHCSLHHCQGFSDVPFQRLHLFEGLFLITLHQRVDMYCLGLDTRTLIMQNIILFKFGNIWYRPRAFVLMCNDS